jgi:hypothetical protein
VSQCGMVEGGAQYTWEKALHRNQFILGPFFIDEFASWGKTKIGSSLCLMTHPDLNVCQVNHENQSLTLIGYMLDPDDSNASDIDITNRLMSEVSDFDRLLEGTYKFGGRWILIADDGKLVRLFHDAFGLRQVFYTDANYTSQIWCASQPRMIAEHLGFGEDLRAINFINASKQRDAEYWWPGDSCPYNEIRHLLPNHYLNLNSGSSCRYWPNRPWKKLPLEEAVEKTAKTLQGLMESISSRYDLAVSLTAGWDSRVVLAASRGIRNKVSYVTVRQGGMPENHADIAVSSLLAENLGLKHDIVVAPPAMDGTFMSIFQKNVSFSHKKWGPDAQAILEYNLHRRVTVTGSVSEVARCFYRPRARQITPQSLSSLVMGDDIFAIKPFENWIRGTHDTFNYDRFDLFYWEQRCGNWLAMCQSEFDIAWKDIFTPFNCRELVVNMLAVDEKYRKPPTCELYKEIMSHLWPEVLHFPFNPHKKKSVGRVLESFVRSQLRHYTPEFIKRSLRRR